jgi:broad-specificity NMP kinase
MKRIGFVGVPGAGKSSVARGIAAQFFNKIRKVEQCCYRFECNTLLIFCKASHAL